jgi:lipoate-protein ligase A
MFERLSLEEALLRHTDDNWILLGTHDVWPPKFLRPSTGGLELPKYLYVDDDDDGNQHRMNTDCMIVMGIGGKPERLLNIQNVVNDKVMVVKRFSGGGTVVMDHNSVWTTLIGRTTDFSSVEPYPRSIMQWSADAVFGPAFDKLTRHVQDSHSSSQNKKRPAATVSLSSGRLIAGGGGKKTLVMDTKSCSATENTGKILHLPTDDVSSSLPPNIPSFALRENDYVLGDDYKMGGNAQSIVKGGWLHHTSFLWDYEDSHMQDYLKLPDKRPDYRKSRPHRDFLVPLSRYFGTSYTPFVKCVREACETSFDLQVAHLPTVLQEVIVDELGGHEAWFAKNRTRIVVDLET